MSPSEDDLRAALRRGEPDASRDLDVDRLVDASRDRAAQRRTRLLSGAAVVVLVAAAGTGSALLWGSDNSPHRAGAQRPGGSSSGSTYARPDGASAARAADATPCPTALPGRLAAGSDGALFAEQPTRFVVCSYAETSGRSPGRTTLGGAQATALRTSLEDAATTRPAGACPLLVRADQRQLAIIGITSDGTTLAPVTTTVNEVACRVVVTNGTAVRYGWQPPAALSPLLTRLAPTSAPPVGAPSVSGELPTVNPGGPAHGSPIHS